MPIDINLPKLGVEMRSAVIDQWYKHEGEWIDKGEALLSIQTEKITYDIESPSEGFLKIIGQPGSEYQIGENLAKLAETKDEYQRLLSGNSTPTLNKETSPTIEIAATRVPEKRSSLQIQQKHRKRTSPLALKIAKDQQINLQDIIGTGPSGVILKRDIMAKIEEIKTANRSAQQSENDQVKTTEKVATVSTISDLKTIKETRPLTGMRKIIAERMYRSLQSTAQMTDINEIEVSALVQFREELNQLKELSGISISYTALLVKAIAIILKEIPILNASIEESEIVIWQSINIGVAVSIEDGLVVPVIQQADKLSIGEIQQQLSLLISKARSNKLQISDLTGSTFTITNIGSYGSSMGTPILNSPEVGILGTGAIKEKPVVKNGEIVIGKVMGTSLTVDHRLIDGEVAGKFQAELQRICENPKLLIIK